MSFKLDQENTEQMIALVAFIKFLEKIRIIDQQVATTTLVQALYPEDQHQLILGSAAVNKDIVVLLKLMNLKLSALRNQTQQYEKYFTKSHKKSDI